MNYPKKTTLVKTFVADSAEDIDKMVNDFKKGNVNVIATQSHIKFGFNEDFMKFVYVVFYTENKN